MFSSCKVGHMNNIWKSNDNFMVQMVHSLSNSKKFYSKQTFVEEN